MLLIDAVYIHESGGKTLLEYLLTTLRSKDQSFMLLLDKRFESPLIADLAEPSHVFLADATETARTAFYKQLDDRISCILCFANVPPPPLKKNRKVFILFHNTLLLAGITENNGYSLVTKLNFFLKKIYIRKRNRPGYEWIVQTNVMAKALQESIQVDKKKIHIVPFFELRHTERNNDTEYKPGTFLYVADGVPQKNHKRLLNAWRELKNEYELTPELHLTIPKRFEDLSRIIHELNESGCRIINHGVLDKTRLTQLYSTSEFLVFPSLAESFGLPLLEAVSNGCKLVTANLQYVFDVVEPADVFDPYKESSIAEAVVRCLKNEKTKPSIIRISNQVQELVKMVTSD